MQNETDNNLYHNLREQIIENSLSFSRKITAFAILEELGDLHAMFSYSRQELSIASDEKLIILSHRIINKLREFVLDMVDYGVDDEALTSFFELTLHFQLASQSITEPSQLISQDLEKNQINFKWQE